MADIGSGTLPAASTSTGTPASTAMAGASWRTVALPTEHGGWSLTAEPVLLGLVVAWSAPGLALGVAAMVAFLARTPLKLVLVDRWRHRRLDRTRRAAQVAAIELVGLAALVGYALAAGDRWFWVPLALAAPLVVIELWYDMRSRGRRLIPELAGSVGIGSVAAAIALADGATQAVAYGLWVVVGARSVAAIPYVRTQILRTRSRPGPIWHSDLAQSIAAAGVAAAWLGGIVPVAAAIAVLLVCIVNAVAVRLRPRRAVVIGVQQMILGLAVIVTTATAVLVS